MSVNRRSNREYPAKRCPHCNTSFIPHDYRQKYCSRQHKINAANDRRRTENLTRFLNEKHLRFNDRILERLYNTMQELKETKITIRELLYSGVSKLNICVDTTQDENDKIVRWFYQYGLQAVNSQATEYKILKRSK